MNITTLIPDEHGDIEWPDVDKDRRVVITLGAFDGMHRGHQAVIDRVVELARLQTGSDRLWWIAQYRRSTDDQLGSRGNHAGVGVWVREGCEFFWSRDSDPVGHLRLSFRAGDCHAQ